MLIFLFPCLTRPGLEVCSNDFHRCLSRSDFWQNAQFLGMKSSSNYSVIFITRLCKVQKLWRFVWELIPQLIWTLEWNPTFYRNRVKFASSRIIELLLQKISKNVTAFCEISITIKQGDAYYVDIWSERCLTCQEIRPFFNPLA